MLHRPRRSLLSSSTVVIMLLSPQESPAAAPLDWQPSLPVQTPASEEQAEAPPRERPTRAKPVRARKKQPTAREQHVAAVTHTLAIARSIDETSGTAASALWLAQRAAELADVDIHLEAARTDLRLPPADATLASAAAHVDQAMQLATGDQRAAWLDVNELSRVRAECDAVSEAIEERRSTLTRERERRGQIAQQTHAAQARANRGRQELIAGGSMLMVAAIGGGLAIAGSAYQRRSEDALGTIEALQQPFDTQPILQLQQRGQNLVAAGAVAAAIGVAIGVPLVAIGARDLRLGRRSEQALTLSVLPGAGSLHFHLRF